MSFNNLTKWYDNLMPPEYDEFATCMECCLDVDPDQVNEDGICNYCGDEIG